jgi:hypothetical protein
LVQGFRYIINKTWWVGRIPKRFTYVGLWDVDIINPSATWERDLESFNGNLMEDSISSTIVLFIWYTKVHGTTNLAAAPERESK